MKKILLLVPTLGYSGFARQLSLLAPRLPRETFQLQVVSLSGVGPLAKPLQETGIPVYGQSGQRFFDVEDWLTLRKRIAESNPDLIHVFGLASLRVLRLACLGRYGKLRILCSPGNDLRKKPGWWTRRLLRGVEAVTAANPWERKELESLEVDASFIRTLTPGVEIDSPDREGGGKLSESSPPPSRSGLEGKKFILCVNGFETTASPRDAVWDFDILRYVDPNLHLVMIGDGPARPSVEHFGRQIAREDHRVHYLGWRDDVRTWMRKAQFVWIPNRQPSGTNVALEAMAEGVPVVAADLPNLRLLKSQEPTMTLIPPGTPTSLARATRHLILNPETARGRVEAAKSYVERHHRPETVVQEWTAIYRSIIL